jgi:hypothetical protein
MGCVLGIGIPVVIVGVFAVLIYLLARSGLKKKKRNAELMRYAASRGFKWVGDDLHGRVEGSRDDRHLSIEFAIVQCSADPGSDAKSFAPRMTMLETVFRMALPGVEQRALVAKPFFRDAIHDPLRGVAPLDLGDPTFQRTYRVFAPPGQHCDWLDADTRSALTQLGTRELRLEHGELSLNLEKMAPSPKRLDRALDVMTIVASRLTG